MLCACQEQQKTNGSRVERLPYYEDPYFTPHWLEKGDPQLSTFHQIADFDLINQDSQAISQKTFEDKIYVTDFFFTTCKGICPKMSANLRSVQEAFRDDDQILLLSHSVTPTEDSVAALKSYAENIGVISEKWHLATGNLSEIYSLGRESYFVEEDLGVDKSDEDFLHTENFILVDKDKHIRGIYNGLSKTSVAQLIADVNTLKEE